MLFQVRNQKIFSKLLALSLIYLIISKGFGVFA